MARAYGASAHLLMQRESAYGQAATGNDRPPPAPSPTSWSFLLAPKASVKPLATATMTAAQVRPPDLPELLPAAAAGLAEVLSAARGLSALSLSPSVSTSADPALPSK